MERKIEMAKHRFPMNSFTLICPRCWYTSHVSVSGTISFDDPVVSPLPERQLAYGCCPKCYDSTSIDPLDRDNEMFACDDMLVPYIVTLNKAGYTTEFCCEGHVEVAEDHFANTHPYILFYTSVKNTRKLCSAVKKIIKDLQFDGYIEATLDTMHCCSGEFGTYPLLKNSEIRAGMRLYIGATPKLMYNEINGYKGPKFSEEEEANLIKGRLQDIFTRFLNKLLNALQI